MNLCVAVERSPPYDRRIFATPHSPMSFTLRTATLADLPRLHELFSLPAVYEFLCDGSPPSKELMEEWVSSVVGAAPPLGLWLLVDAQGDLFGCARLSEAPAGVATAELTYVLHPDVWGQGLATAMSRSVLARAFEAPACESALAGADLPNAKSIQVMKRLGMRLLRNVEYPAGPGVEYVIKREEITGAPQGPRVPFFEP